MIQPWNWLVFETWSLGFLWRLVFGPWILAPLVIIVLRVLVSDQAQPFQPFPMSAHKFRRITRVTFDPEPDVSIKRVIINTVRFAEIHLADFFLPRLLFG